MQFFALLASPDSPPAALVRSAFLPALLATNARPRDASQAAQFDEEIRSFFCAPPNVVVVQGIITPDQISQAWATAPKGGPVGESVFLAFALNQELESAKNGGEKEEEANLNSEWPSLEFEVGSELTLDPPFAILLLRRLPFASPVMILATLTYELAHWIYVKVNSPRIRD